MATVTKSIGSAGRDYATPILWEADLDNGGIYGAGDDAVGEMYNDSVFISATITVDGGSVIGLNSIRLTAASGERHTGTVGTGVRIKTTGAVSLILDFGGTVPFTLEDIELDGDNTTCWRAVFLSVAGGVIQRCLCYGFRTTGTSIRAIILLSTSTTAQNNFIFDCLHASGSGGYYGIRMLSHTTTVNNNSIFDIDSAAGVGYGISMGSNFVNITRNNCVCNSKTADYHTTFGGAPTNSTITNNLSSDATAWGTSAQLNKLAANQFTNIGAGTEDLHLKTGADAIGNGVDLGGGNVAIDIDLRDRDAQGDIWDIGAHQFVLGVTPTGVIYEIPISYLSNILLEKIINLDYFALLSLDKEVPLDWVIGLQSPSGHIIPISFDGTKITPSRSWILEARAKDWILVARAP